jgi:hypothetical protein
MSVQQTTRRFLGPWTLGLLLALPPAGVLLMYGIEKVNDAAERSQ